MQHNKHCVCVCVFLFSNMPHSTLELCMCVLASLCVSMYLKEGEEGGLYDEYGSIVRPCLPPQGTICSLSMHHLLV